MTYCTCGHSETLHDEDCSALVGHTPEGHEVLCPCKAFVAEPEHKRMARLPEIAPRLMGL